jgi:TetR/AcrR family transcriptional repressor of nem operon
MGRPIEFDTDQALSILKEEIWTYGFEACSVKSMSEKLGITRSSFYNTFGSREKVLMNILDSYSEAGPEREMFEINKNKSVLKSITEKMKMICDYQVEHCRGCLAASSIQEVFNKNEKLENYMTMYFSRNISYFEKILKIAIERKELKPCDTRVKALALQNFMVGISEMSKVFRSKEDLWAISKHTLEGLNLFSK